MMRPFLGCMLLLALVVTSSHTPLDPTEDESPLKHFTYAILTERAHPKTYFTQGLTFHRGSLIESIGLAGQSALIRYRMNADGSPAEPELKSAVPSQHFGEGLTEMNGKLYQLTWKDGKVHVWDADTLVHVETRSLPGNMQEGWGLATAPDQDALIMTEGSGKLFWVEPDASVENGGFLVKKEVVVRDCESNIPSPHVVGGLNELETVPFIVTHPEEALRVHSSRGSPNFEQVRKSKPMPPGALVWANIYGTQCIAVIDPNTGKVRGYVHLDGLNPTAGVQSQVTNGIAYRYENQALWVTGKNWEKMFQIELVEMSKPPDQFPSRCYSSWGGVLGVHPKKKYPEDLCPKTTTGRREL